MPQIVGSHYFTTLFVISTGTTNNLHPIHSGPKGYAIVSGTVFLEGFLVPLEVLFELKSNMRQH
jgi:hypothetical protein